MLTCREPERVVIGHRLRSDLAVVCGHLNVLHAQMVRIVREAIATDAWHGEGVRSIEHWLSWQAGISFARARQVVEVARREDLPETYGLFADGLLTLDQTAAVARWTPSHHDRTAAQMARNMTVGQLSIALGKRFFPPASAGEPIAATSEGDETPSPQPTASPSPPPAPAPSPCHHAVHAGFDDSGDFFLRASAEGADGAVVLRALQEARDALFRAGQTDATWLDALIEMSRRSLQAITSVSRREAYRVIVHLDSEGAWIHQGPRVPPHAFTRWTCDGVVQPLWHRDGQPINLGRNRHIVPLRTRIVVENRDRICVHPLCTTSTSLTIHHIHHWAHGGSTDTGNLICLCPHHHRQLHRGAFTISGDANQPETLQFRTHDGHRISGRAVPTPPFEAPPPDPTAPYTHPLGERLDTRWLHYGPPSSRSGSGPPQDALPATASTTTSDSTDQRARDQEHSQRPPGAAA